MIKEIAGVAVGGAIGSLCRFGLTRWLSSHNPHPAFSVGVIASNLIGCFLIGFLFVKLQSLDPGPKDALTALLITGFLGGLTTFSTYSLELYRMGSGGAWKWLTAYLLAHLLIGLLAVWAGASLATRSA